MVVQGYKGIRYSSMYVCVDQKLIDRCVEWTFKVEVSGKSATLGNISMQPVNYRLITRLQPPACVFVFVMCLSSCAFIYLFYLLLVILLHTTPAPTYID